ncbi:putative glycolipid-binding domain-containing protein [Chromobacterium sp. IIBBL 290-4]|uniref:putative glycolipid-binding domain-containing protein n=1 Tax=Chromobacterium sp. IIBBL 290-4 TaxID=2953890 RepID=UPI0020B6DFC9|nr:putative glycolipid-binding domain-containing protein [Chromobacterium sp. IIBBL 290-4]UTH73713.1 putative glycolipid-binding domain-containing protein [Chromobacterium sp. IIBBL 290-4]
MKQTLYWQRLDCPGLEQVELETGADLALSASGSLLHTDSGASLRYRMQLDHHGRLSHAHIDLSAPEAKQLTLQHTESGRWLINGMAQPAWDACQELDLQACGLTNAFPIRRLKLGVGDSVELAMLFVRLPTLTPTVCPQRYTRLPDQNGLRRYHYASPGFAADILVDEQGFTIHYSDFLQRLPSGGHAAS